MKLQKSALASILTFGLFALFATPSFGASAWEPDVSGIEASGFQIDYTKGKELIFIDEEGNTGGTVVLAETPGKNDREICTELGSNQDCGSVGKHVGGQVLLPACESQIKNCIEALEVSGGEGTFQPASYIKTTAGTTFTGNPALGVPDGTGPAIYTAPVQNSETSEYTIKAQLNFWNNLQPDGSYAFMPSGLSLRIFPTKETSMPNAEPAVAEIQEMTNDGKAMSIGVSGIQGCVYQDTGICGRELDFAPSTSFRVTLVLSNRLTGWFRGRILNPVISITEIDANYSRFVIEGSPVEVPRFLSTFSLADGDPDVIGPLNQNAHGGLYTLFEAASLRAMEVVNGLRVKTKDTAAGISTVWSMNTISGQQATGGSPESEKCLEGKSQVLGIVTTNAMSYTGAIPDFNAGYLSYRVAGLHYAPNGKDLNLGTYDLVMRSETARCLYGFTKAPVSATVQVVGEQGAENIATTIVSEKDGWLKLAAYGFTFSEKEIQVKLTQPQNKTLTKFAGSTRTLTSKQKAEIKAVVNKAKGNPKFICTGVYANAKDKVTALKRARAACDYAKTLDKNHSYWAQAKQTKAKSYDGKVMVVSK